MKKNGFTLIELMIVIAIIATIAAILIPNYAKAKAQAQYAACVQNVKNIAIAAEMYQAENGRLAYAAQWKTLLCPNYIARVPTCPASGKEYWYERHYDVGWEYFGIMCHSGGVNYHKYANVVDVCYPCYYEPWGLYSGIGDDHF